MDLKKVALAFPKDMECVRTSAGDHSFCRYFRWDCREHERLSGTRTPVNEGAVYGNIYVRSELVIIMATANGKPAVFSHGKFLALFVLFVQYDEPRRHR